MTRNSDTNYYMAIRAKMMREFNAMYRSTRDVLLQYFTKPIIDRLQDESKREYTNLFPELPYIGGRRNKETINLIMGAIVLAIVRPLEKEKLTKHQIGRVIYDTFDGYFKAKPRFILRAIGRLASSNFFAKRMKMQIEKNSRREYEDNFVTEYVVTDGDDFDFGYNYTECALHKLYTQHEATKYLPYVCLGDYALFRSLGIGFTRTQTIANGAPKCDFRFKRNGKTATGWPPECLEEWNGEQYRNAKRGTCCG